MTLPRRGLNSCLFVVALVFVPAALGVRGNVAGKATLRQGEDVTRHDGLPLSPTRTIRFTTEEGTWISLDISPNGRTIVFDLLGDLYTIPVAGGTATRITSGMAFDAQPRYSPDGRRLVFTSDRDGWKNVWIADADGSSPRRITRYRWGSLYDRVESPEWTPDGRAVIVSERFGEGFRGGTRLVEYDVTSGLGRPLTNLEEDDRRWYIGAAFGSEPDVIYAAVRAPESLTGTLWQIARINRRTLDVELETTPPAGRHAIAPVLSRDGRFLVYGSPSGDATGLRLRNLRSGSERWLTKTAQRNVVPWSSYGGDGRNLMPGSAFTPDGESYVTSYGGGIWRLDVATGRAMPIPFRAEVEQQLGPLVKFQYPFADEPFDVRAVRNPQISPDGSRVVFSALDRLWIADLPPLNHTGNTRSDGDRAPSVVPRRVTASDIGEFFPAWSPDGEQIAYTTWSDSDGGAIYRVAADGRDKPRRLTREPGVYANTAWDATGDRVFSVRAAPETWRRLLSAQTHADEFAPPELILVPVTGGPVRSLTPLHVYDRGLTAKLQYFVYGQPQVLPHVDRVLVYEPDRGLVGVSPTDGRRETWLALVEDLYDDRVREEWRPDEVLLSPDRRHALVLRGITDLPVLLGFSDVAPSDISIPSMKGALQPPTNSRRHLSAVPADFIGWTRTGRPYYSVGSSLFIGNKAPDGANDPALTFRRIDIRLRARADRAPGTLALRGARVITMRGREVLERGDILVRDGRIAAVGPQGQVAIPPDAHTLDFRGKTILPGFIDIHNHLGHIVAWGVHAQQEWRLLVELALGVTTIRDPAGYSTDLMAIQERVRTGDLLGPRVYTVWPGLVRRFFGDGSTQDLASTRDLMRIWSHFYRTETIKQYLSGGRRTRQLIAIAAREQGLMPTNEGGWNTAMNLTMAIDGYPGLEHDLPATPQYRDVVELIARSGMIQTHTQLVVRGMDLFRRRFDPWSDPRLQRFLPRDAVTYFRTPKYSGHQVTLEVFREIAAQPAKIVAAGACIGLGSHGNLPGLGAHWEMWSLALGGMAAHDVLRVATWCSADAIGHGADLGSIEPGKIADLQVLEKNPLENIHHTASTLFVMKGGRLYDASTLAEVWPRRGPPVRMWWHE